MHGNLQLRHSARLSGIRNIIPDNVAGPAACKHERCLFVTFPDEKYGAIDYKL